MEKDEVYLFEKNTDAVGTNRGFLYQYLVTLKDWVINYITKNRQDIYCEYEDDIKEVTSHAEKIVFKQIKNYDSPFNVNSEEIEKSLYNFFMLHLKYKNKFKTEFVFFTNSYISRNDNILNKWIKKEDVNSIKIEVIKILLKKLEIDKKAKIKALDNRISKYKENPDINNDKISKANEKKIEIEKEANLLINSINLDDNITNFVQCVFFDFKNEKCDDSIQSIKSDILEQLDTIDECKKSNNIYFSRFLTEINEKSSISNKDDRKLTIDLFQEILQETYEDILNNTDNAFIELLVNNFENMNIKLDVVSNKIDELSENVKGKIITKNKMSLPSYSKQQIEDMLKADDNSSHLEDKIKKIGMNEEDTNYLIELAEKNRCRYLLYKDELKKNNLIEELDILQSLEDTLRCICFKKVQEYTYKPNFDSRKFWYALMDELRKVTTENELFLEYKFQDDIIYGQMYEIAAQCPLRWHKN